MPQTLPLLLYSFHPDPERYPRTTHSTGNISARMTIMERPRSSSACDANGRRIAIDIGGDKMVRRKILQQLEPEQRNLRQNPALMRDAGGKNIVERGDAVGSYEQEVLVIQAVNIAYFAARVQLQLWIVGLQKNGIEEFGAHDVILAAKNFAYSNWREKFVNAFGRT